MTHGTENRSGIRTWESLGDGSDIWKQSVSGLHWLRLSQSHIRLTQETYKIVSPQTRDREKKLKKLTTYSEKVPLTLKPLFLALTQSGRRRKSLVSAPG